MTVHRDRGIPLFVNCCHGMEKMNIEEMQWKGKVYEKEACKTGCR